MKFLLAATLISLALLGAPATLLSAHLGYGVPMEEAVDVAEAGPPPSWTDCGVAMECLR